MSRVYEAELAGLQGSIDQLLEEGKLPSSALWSADDHTTDGAPDTLAEKLRALQGQEGGVPLRHAGASGEDLLVEVMEVLVEGRQVRAVVRQWRGNTTGTGPEPAPEGAES